MGGHFWRRFMGFAFTIGVLALVAGFAYQAGTHMAVGEAGGGMMRTYGGHGFFFFPFLFFPFGLFLFFGLMKMLFWGGPRHWSGGDGMHPNRVYQGGPWQFEEWHRHAHEQGGAGTPSAPSASTPGGTGSPGPTASS